MRTGGVDLATGAGVGAILLWSTTFAFARSLSEQVGPITAGAAAYLLGGGFCLLRLAMKRRSWRELGELPPKYLLGCGALFIYYTAALYGAIGMARSRQELLEIALVNYLWPALTVLGSVLLLKQRASPWLLPGTVLALAGVFLVLVPDGEVSWAMPWRHLGTNPAAFGLVLSAAVAWGLYSNLARLWTAPGSRGAVELFVPATGLVLLAMRLGESEPGHWTARAALEAAALAAVTTVSYVLWDFSMRRGNLVLVVACSYLTPLLSTLVSCLYLGVSPGLMLWIGCALLVSGSVLTWRSVSEAPRRMIVTPSVEPTPRP